MYVNKKILRFPYVFNMAACLRYLCPYTCNFTVCSLSHALRVTFGLTLKVLYLKEYGNTRHRYMFLKGLLKPSKHEPPVRSQGIGLCQERVPSYSDVVGSMCSASARICPKVEANCKRGSSQ